MRGGRLALAAWLLTAGAETALAQSVIGVQPLPPPAGVSATPPAPPPRPPASVARPPAHHVPVVRAPHAAVKRPAPPHHPVVKPAAKPAPKPTPKPATKPAPPPVEPAAPPPAPPKIDPNKGTNTGLPLPRWAAFRSDDVNLRSGPGMQYPIDWVYHRRDLPVRILREFEVWRLVEEQDGTKGWVHEATLTGRRGFVVQGGEQILRASPADTADPVAKLEPGVVGHIRRCPAASEWCDVAAGDYHGWLKRSAMYGVSSDEAVE